MLVEESCCYVNDGWCGLNSSLVEQICCYVKDGVVG